MNEDPKTPSYEDMVKLMGEDKMSELLEMVHPDPKPEEE